MVDGLIRIAKYGLPVLGGMVAGALASMLVSSNKQPRIAEESMEIRPVLQTAGEATPAGSPQRSQNAGLLARMAERLSDLEQRVDEKKNQENAEPQADSPSVTDAEIGQLHQREHQDLIRMHEQEPRDASWAQATAQGLQGNLGKISARNQFKVLNVDCRTTLCTAKVEWPSRDQARKTYSSLLEPDPDNPEPNCAKEIVLPEAPGNTAPFQATAIFQCRDFD